MSRGLPRVRRPPGVSATLPPVPPEACSALAHLVARLRLIADEAPDLPAALRARVAALARAVADLDRGTLLALGASEPPAEVDAWWDDRAIARDLPEAAVWLTESAARRLAAGERVRLAPVIQATEAWAETLPGAL